MLSIAQSRISRADRFAVSMIAAGVLATAPPCLAQQKSTENAVTSSDDAFGTSVGLETTGIYSQYSTRGFSPLDAGNARLDGIYFDPVSLVTLRARSSQAIRVGYAALEYPFAAPTGIVDNQLRTARNDLNIGVELHSQQYGSWVGIADTQIPIVDDHLSLVAGASHGHGKFIDGTSQDNYSLAFKPVIRFDGGEISPFYSANYVRNQITRPVILIGGDFVPDIPRAKRHFGSSWAQEKLDNVNYGVTVKTRITDRLYVRGGLFNSVLERKRNFTEIFRVNDRAGNTNNTNHLVIADPPQHLNSWSGEVQLAYHWHNDRWQHRVIAGFRGRDRTTEFGGSDTESFPDVTFGDLTEEPEPDFSFSPVNVGKVRQTALMLGYLGKLEGVGKINLGIQRASFRGRSNSEGTITGTREKEWLYNASLGVEITPSLMIYGGTQRGLEDNGAAKETAENRNEQLRPGLSTQYEAGLRWKTARGIILIGVFEISKPYYSFDRANFYRLLGTEKHRGIEASYSGHFFDDRLNLLLGGLLMDPVVSGPGRDDDIVGKRPVGIRGTRLRLDATYRTDWLSGFTPTLAIAYRGSTAAVSEPIAPNDDRQISIRSRMTVDVGFRLPLSLAGQKATLRGKVDNLFNQKRWLSPASRTLLMADQRNFQLSLLMDF